MNSIKRHGTRKPRSCRGPWRENAFATNAVIETILSRSAANYYDPD